MVDERVDAKPVYFNRVESIGVEQVSSFLGDVDIKDRLSEPDRSYVLAAGCFLEARNGGKIDGFERAKFLSILKAEFVADPRFALAVVMDLIVYVAGSAEWKFEDVFGEAAVRKPEVVALWGVLADGSENALIQYLNETSVLEKGPLGDVIGSFANNLEQGIEIEGNPVKKREEIGPRVIFVPKEAGKRLKSWLAKPEVKPLFDDAVGGLVGKIGL